MFWSDITFLGFCAAPTRCLLLTFRDSVSVPSSGMKTGYFESEAPKWEFSWLFPGTFSEVLGQFHNTSHSHFYILLGSSLRDSHWGLKKSSSPPVGTLCIITSQITKTQHWAQRMYLCVSLNQQQNDIISLYIIRLLDFVMVTECVFCALRTTQIKFLVLEG